MEITIQDQLRDFITGNYSDDTDTILSYLPACAIDASTIKAVMINEVVADCPENDFYSPLPTSYYMTTTVPLFRRAGVDVREIADILQLGIYITSAVKLPKVNTTIEPATIERFVPLLQRELALFPALDVIMLMGDVARKAVNGIAKGKTRRNAVPAGSTYKLRHSKIVYDGIRLLPAYIMTGQNLAIEPSKTAMSVEEVSKMLHLIGCSQRNGCPPISD